jgi:nicotinamide-nucleotide amidase
MMERVVLPEVTAAKAGQVIHYKILSTIGIAESTLFEKIGDIQAVEDHARVAFLPAPSGIRIRLTVMDQDESSAINRLQKATALIRKNIEPYIFADEDISLERVIARQLIAAGKMIAVAESCTGGLIANKFTDIPGSSQFFERGVVTYSNAAKTELLGVPEELIRSQGAVSAEVACAMAEGIRRVSRTDYGLATTGIAGPDGGTAEKPVGLVYVALADHNSTTVHERHTFAKDRLVNKERFAYAALNLLHKKLRGIVD